MQVIEKSRKKQSNTASEKDIYGSYVGEYLTGDYEDPVRDPDDL